jgi:prepilin-type N-terminal cleavage/methylation domain-containing protein
MWNAETTRSLRREGSRTFAIQHSRFRIRRAFTLVEMLLALSLTALVAAVTGRIAVQTLTNQTDVERRAHERDREAIVLEQLEEDFEGLLVGLPGEAAPLAVFGMPRPVLQLSTLAVIPNPGAALHGVRRPAMVRYRLVEGHDDPQELNLVRELIDRTSVSAVPLRETIAARVADFGVEVLNKGQWVAGYPPADARLADAQAVRVSCRWSNQQQPMVRTFAVQHAR